MTRATYLDSSAIVKLAVAEPESSALRRYLRRRKPYVSSALARAEVGRALLPSGSAATRRGVAVLARIDLVRVSDPILRAAGGLVPEHRVWYRGGPSPRRQPPRVADGRQR